MTDDEGESGGGGDADADLEAEVSISPETLAERLRAGDRFSLLDVRARDEFETWHVEGEGVDAVRVPHYRFVESEATGDLPDGVADLTEPVVAVCGRGEASAHAVSVLREAGVAAANLAGGMDAWADLLVARELSAPVGGSAVDPVTDGPADDDSATDAPTDTSVTDASTDDAAATVVQYDRPSSGCLSYLIVAGSEAAVVDPLRAFVDRYRADAADRGAALGYAIDTHVHADHVSGVRALASATDATPVVPDGAVERGLAFDATTIGDGDDLRVGEASLEAIATPGHTTESLSYRLGAVLFAGDTLFLDGVGRPDLESGGEAAADAAGRLYETLHERVLALPDETVVAPGHYDPAAPPVAVDPPATVDPAGSTADGDDPPYVDRLGAIRDRLETLALDRAAFVDRIATDLPPPPANAERILAVNLGREDADDETAFGLELGPNNCAVGD